MKIVRRIGPDPHALRPKDGPQQPTPQPPQPTQTPAAQGCPDIWETDSGDVIVIGIDKTDELREHLPPTASCGPDERIVWIPRRTLVDAGPDISVL